MGRNVLGAALVGLFATVVFASCSGNRATDPASRFFAVHNVMLGLGMSQTGAVSEGTLARGQEVRLPVTLGAGCVAVVAVGGGGVTDLGLQLVDGEGAVVAQENRHDAEAIVRTCVEPGSYGVVITMAEGAGDYVVSSFSGGDFAVPDAGGAPLAAGTCDEPNFLLPGHVYTGTTDGGSNEHEGNCVGNVSGEERVYRLDVRARQHVIIDVTAEFDSVLYLRKGSCEDEDAEVQCNDDAGAKHSRINAVLEAGTYFVFVDSYGENSGNYQLEVKISDVPSVAEICQQAAPLPSGSRLVGTLKDAFDNVNSSCGRDAKGPDVPFRFDLPVRARVRFAAKSSDFRPVVHVRRVCEDPTSEVACSDTGLSDEEGAYVGVLDAGTYTVFADSSDETAQGAFALSAETAPVSGGKADHAGGDGCGEAIDLLGTSGTVEGDTFATRDNAHFSCGMASAPDLFYRVEVTERSRLSAKIASDQSSHFLGLMRSCGDGAVELACGGIIDRLLEPGIYFLVVDGARAESLGRFTMNYQLKNVVRLDAACARAKVLRFGHTESGSTTGGSDNFSLTCARGAGGTLPSPDRVYRFSVGETTPVELTLESRTFRGSLSVRHTCTEDNSEMQCVYRSEGPGEVTSSITLDRGTYYVVVDGYGPGAEGPFTLRLDAGKSKGRTVRSPRAPAP